MSEITFNVGGRTMTAGTIIATADKRKPKPKAEKPAAYHKGYIVEGYAPGRIAEAEAERIKECAEWAALTSDEQAKRTRSGERAPKPWDLNHWLATTKRRKVRSKPYEIASAADECAAIAERAGWEYVRVVEAKHGESQQAELA